MRNKVISKKVLINLGLLAISLMSFCRIACSEENQRRTLSVKFRAGFNYVNFGDINRHLEDYDNYLSEITSYEGGKITKLRKYKHTLEGELSLNINSKIAVGAGIEYVSEKKEGYIEFKDPYPFYFDNVENSHTISTKPEVSAVSLKLGIFYIIPLISRINIFLDGGLDYYFSKAVLYKSYEILPGFITIDGALYYKEEKYDVNANGLGFHGGFGLEYKILNDLSIVLEIQEKYARIKNLNGKRIFSVLRGLDRSEGIDEGVLYVGEREMAGDWIVGYIPDLIISLSKPEGNEFRNIKEAAFDFSGYSLKLGIKISLF